MSGSYTAITALIFAVVACLHLARLLKRWPAQIGSYTVPMVVSWLGLPISALLAIWGIMLSVR